MIFMDFMFMAVFLITVIHQQQSAHGKVEHRVLNGNDAADGQFPYQAAMLAGTKRSLYCGAAIINEEFVLTAAHCCDVITRKELFKVAVGITDLTVINPGTQFLGIQRTDVHPNYQSALGNDICLVKLSEKISMEPGLKEPIPLPSFMEEPSLEAPAILSGWGRTRSGDPSSVPNRLQYAKKKIIKDETCRMKGYYWTVRDSDICAEAPQLSIFASENAASCNGDSGGPLVSNGTLIGVVSRGMARHCGAAPSVYTQVSHYIPWIKSTMIDASRMNKELKTMRTGNRTTSKSQKKKF